MSPFSSPLTGRLIAPLLIVAITAGSFAYMAVPNQKPAHAALPVFETNPNLLEHDTFLGIKEAVLDTIVSLLVRTVVHSFTQMITNWITGNSGKDVNFFQNFEQQLLDIAVNRGNEYFRHLTGINLCTIRMRRLILPRVQIGYANFRLLRPQLECTLDRLIANLDNFYDNFGNGGWPVFLENNLVPQNNPFGSFMIAQTNHDLSIGSKDKATTQNIQANRGFGGVQVKVKAKRCEYDEDESGGLIEQCYEEDKITTPGGIVADALTESFVDTQFSNLISADELSELISGMVNTIFTVFIGELISGRLFD